VITKSLWRNIATYCTTRIGPVARQAALRDEYLLGRLWDTTCSCLGHLAECTSAERLQAFTRQTFQGFVSLYQSSHYSRPVWAEGIALLAWTAADIGADESENWQFIARCWYKKASLACPGSGKYLLNLALVHERPLYELFYFSKSVISLDPVPASAAKLKPLRTIYDTIQSPSEVLFIKATRLLLQQETKKAVNECADELRVALVEDEKLLASNGATVACIMCAALLGFGDPGSPAFRAMSELRQWQDDPGYIIIRESMRVEQWRFLRCHVSTENLDPCASVQEINTSAAELFHMVASIALAARCDSFTYILLSFIFALSHSPDGLIYLESAIPWHTLVRCLNQIRFKVRDPAITGPAGSLEEDVMLHGYMWSWMLFRSGGVCESLDAIEVPCMVQLRLQRCMHLAQAITKVHSILVWE
jgi:hypothetical protein